MKLDVVSNPGDLDKPAVVFIHGLGLDKDIWVNPYNSRILGGMFPLRTLLARKISEEKAGNVRTLFDDLKLKGYSVITWSQRRTDATIDSVVKELQEIVAAAKDITHAGIIIVGHSRGGLAGRKYLSMNSEAVKALITIATPHKGSSVARLAKYVSPLASMLSPLFSGGDKGTITFAIKKVLEFLKSRAIRELLPESNFIRHLKDGPLEGIYYASVGGINPTLFSINNFSFPDFFEKIMPLDLFPDELKQGRGDGLVSAESSKLDWGKEHHNYACNHAEILFDENVREDLLKMIERIP
jgi:pimeloyl-ACP methyl ester carboxylesterase